MRKYDLPNVPYVEANISGEKQKPTAILIEMSMTTSDPGAALGIVNHLHQRNSPANSYHYVLDETKTFKGVRDHISACKSPHRAINILVCGEPVTNMKMWFRPPYLTLMRRTAKLVAELSLAHKIRPVYLESDDADRWMKRRFRRRGGIIVRVPGEWPKASFLAEVHSNLDALTNTKSSSRRDYAKA